MVFQAIAIFFPVEVGTGISFAPGGNVGVSGNVLNGVVIAQTLGQCDQRDILSRGESCAVAAFQLDTYGEVIAALLTQPAGNAGMPGAFETGDELDHCAIAADEEMCRYLQVLQGLIVRVRLWVDAIGEQFDYAISAKLIRWQTDVVYDQQGDIGSSRAIVAIG